MISRFDDLIRYITRIRYHICNNGNPLNLLVEISRYIFCVPTTEHVRAHDIVHYHYAFFEFHRISYSSDGKK